VSVLSQHLKPEIAVVFSAFSVAFLSNRRLVAQSTMVKVKAKIAAGTEMPRKLRIMLSKIIKSHAGSS
jgi:hypothetical protein